MNPSIQLKTTTLPFLIAFALACFGPLPSTQALAPPPDGGYPGANTAEGTGALSSLSPQGRGSGANNTALGYHTLFSDTTGSFNTATGSVALANNNGDNNTATGYQALVHNTTGSDNTAIGYQAAFSNIGGFVAEGFYNTAIGSQALYSNSTGGNNTALGFQALFSLTGPYGDNTAIGFRALQNITTGYQNIALGENAGQDLTTGHNNIDIGNLGVDTDSQTIRIGDSNFQTATYIAGISGQAASGGVAVYVNSDGKLGTSNSSIRFKDAIKPMDKASEAIHALKPVTFHYKKELDPKSIPQFGLVAEEVEKVNPDLVARDRDGKPYTVRYEAVNAMLLNEFLKEHRTVQELKSAMAKQEAIIAKQQKGMEALTAQLKEQAAQIQNVSAQLETRKPGPQVVENNQR
jgi:uncharacterized coiled-coil protein SlyX